MTEGLRHHESLREMVLRKVPAGRFGTAEEIAALVTFLVSDVSAYITGQILTADGGFAVS
jgi:NAD(P)-dependent dehydrogenase (short-subunit alcohol dehydrogenase family)